MHTRHKHFSFSSRMMRAFAIFLFPLLLAALACNFQSGGDQTLRETDIAIGIQQTLIAQTATALEAALVAPPSTLPAAETPQSQPEATQPPSPTPVEVAKQPSLPTDTPTAIVTPTSPAPASIPIVDWGLSFWAQLNSGCKVKDTLCWKMDDNYKKHLGSSNLVLISKTPILIEESWPNPYLTFWHKYDLERAGNIDLQVGSTWLTIRAMAGKSSGGTWVQETIDLRDYIGKTLIIRFSAQGIWGSGGIKGSDWFVNDVNLVPDYQPNP